MAVAVFGAVLLIAAGCASVEEVQRPGGETEHVISCGYFNWNYCYERAKQLCPDGYKVLSESEGYRPKDLRVACTSAKRASLREFRGTISPTAGRRPTWRR